MEEGPSSPQGPRATATAVHSTIQTPKSEGCCRNRGLHTPKKGDATPAKSQRRAALASWPPSCSQSVNLSVHWERGMEKTCQGCDPRFGVPGSCDHWEWLRHGPARYLILLQVLATGSGSTLGCGIILWLLPLSRLPGTGGALATQRVWRAYSRSPAGPPLLRITPHNGQWKGGGSGH